MNTVFLLGNGFDISLHYKTSYRNFYKYYKVKKKDSESVRNLKDNIKGDHETWADLEAQLGEYSKQVSSDSEFITLVDHIVDNLCNYLEAEEKRFEVEEVKHAQLIEWLCFPERKLLPRDMNIITQYRTNWVIYQWNVRIITFNYTRILDRMLVEDHHGPLKVNPIRIGSHTENRPIVLDFLEHVHGYTDTRTVLGVNDVSQLKNSDFIDNKKVHECFIKKSCNAAGRHNVDLECATVIESANLICIHGCSLGETDLIWWELIGEQLKRGCKLIIFYWDDKKFNLRRDYKLSSSIDEVITLFLNRTKLSSEEKVNSRDSIYVAIKKGPFT